MGYPERKDAQSRSQESVDSPRRLMRWLGRLVRRAGLASEDEGAVSSHNVHKNGNNSEAAERERAQNHKLPEATVAFGASADIPVVPPDYKPRGPTPAEIKGRALVQEAMLIKESPDEPLPPLYQGSDND